MDHWRFSFVHPVRKALVGVVVVGGVVGGSVATRRQADQVAFSCTRNAEQIATKIERYGLR